MNGLDIFAWIVLLILFVVIVLVIWLMGSLPGHVAKRRGHPWADAVGVAGWITYLRFCAVAARVDLGLPAGATETAAIFTDRVKVSHVTRRVLLRQIAILNYVNPF